MIHRVRPAIPRQARERCRIAHHRDLLGADAADSRRYASRAGLAIERAARATGRRRSSLLRGHLDPGHGEAGPLNVLDGRADRVSQGFRFAVEVDAEHAVTAPDPGIVAPGFI